VEIVCMNEQSRRLTNTDSVSALSSPVQDRQIQDAT
jgi:hypothetical protein